jgi:hypothetical protein
MVIAVGRREQGKSTVLVEALCQISQAIHASARGWQRRLLGLQLTCSTSERCLAIISLGLERGTAWGCFKGRGGRDHRSPF